MMASMAISLKQAELETSNYVMNVVKADLDDPATTLCCDVCDCSDTSSPCKCSECSICAEDLPNNCTDEEPYLDGVVAPEYIASPQLCATSDYTYCTHIKTASDGKKSGEDCTDDYIVAGDNYYYLMEDCETCEIGGSCTGCDDAVMIPHRHDQSCYEYDGVYC